jgi:tripartite-type tricarboxylate transporter receptor subunit TctC
MRQLSLILAAMLMACAAWEPALAQNYPNHTVRIVVPYAPGGGVSILAQNVAGKMQELLKQPVIVDNRPGAGGTLGADVVAKSAPDGYTLLMHTSAMSSLSSLYSKLPFDPAKDFAPISMVISTQFIIAGSPKIPPKNLHELIALAKDKPGTLNFGSSGPGSTLHLFAEMFNDTTGIKTVHIPYRSDAAMITSLISGDIQFAFLPQANGIAAIQGKLIPGLGVTGTKRMEAIPDVPTALEQGVKGLEVGSWVGLFAPHGTPADVVHTVQQALATALTDAKIREWLISTGQNPVGNSSAEFQGQFKADVERFAKVIEAAHIQKLD